MPTSDLRCDAVQRNVPTTLAARAKQVHARLFMDLGSTHGWCATVANCPLDTGDPHRAHGGHATTRALIGTTHRQLFVNRGLGTHVQNP